jgi:RHS repeat-associated protein
VKTSTNDFGTTTYDYVYDRGMATTRITNPAGQQRSTTRDAIGRVLEAKDNGGGLRFNYDSWGNPLLTTNGHTVYLSREYNEQGQLVREDDQDAGRTTYTYNPFGVQITETDAEGNVTRLDYLDKLGRLTQKAIGAYTTTYRYHGSAKENKLAEAKTTGPDGLITDSTDYNSKGELVREWRSAAGFSLEKHYSYDVYGRLSTTAYSSGLKLKRCYDSNGYLECIQTDPAGGATRTLFKAVSRNGMGQYTRFVRDNGEGSLIDYYHGIPTRYYTPGLQDLNLRYDYTNGNLLERRDLNRGLKETFTYDKLDRLVISVVDGPGGTGPAINIDYDRPSWGSRGNIIAKTDAGDYRYSANKVVEINNPKPAISHALQTIAYTPFRKVGLIQEPGPGAGLLYQQRYIYNGEQERVYSRFAAGGIMKEQRWYSGNLERQLLAGTSGRFIHYLQGGGHLAAIVITEGETHTYYTIYTDHLGSVVKVTDETGREMADLDYNAWGRERKAVSWDYPASGTTAGVRPSWLYRGYTGHEMLPQFDLIDMNGRMYDPVTGRMLRPDNYIQDPLNTQNYNRYSYCLNNPLKYTDPSGDQYVGLSSYGYANAYAYAGAYNGIPYTATYNHSFYIFNNAYSSAVHNGYTTTTYNDWIAATESSTSADASYGPWSAAYSLSSKTSFSSTFFTIGPPAEAAAETYAAYSYNATTSVIAGMVRKPTFEGTSLDGVSAGAGYDEFIISLNPATALPNFISKTITGRSITGYELQAGSAFEMVGPAAARVGAAARGTIVIGETMDRVIDAAAKMPGSKFLNTMPRFTGTTDQITSQIMQYNRKWILNEMRSGRTILDIGFDAGRTNRSVFYEMEKNMLMNYQKLYPRSLNIVKP